MEKKLASITLAPYIVKAMALIGKRRWAGSNQFRHQMETLAILLDYKILDPVLLKAAVIHDLFEDASGMPWVTREAIVGLDSDGEAVYALVQEVTIRVVNGVKEPKSEYLTRVMTTGSAQAKLLKLADRLSNMISLGYVHDQKFVQKTVDETKAFILPHSEGINAQMHRELADLVSDREYKLRTRLEPGVP